MQPDGIRGRETPAMVLNDGKIRHPLPCLLHGKELLRLSEQTKVRPQDAAQKPYTVDYHLSSLSTWMLSGASAFNSSIRAMS